MSKIADKDASMDDLKVRLKEYIAFIGVGSMRKFEAECGITNGTISAVGPMGPSAAILSRIIERYPKLSLNWLLSGKGSMEIPDNPPAKAPILPQNRTEQPKAINYPSVSVQNVQAVFITNWQDVASVVEQTVKNVMGK